MLSSCPDSCSIVLLTLRGAASIFRNKLNPIFAGSPFEASTTGFTATGVSGGVSFLVGRMGSTALGRSLATVPGSSFSCPCHLEAAPSAPSYLCCQGSASCDRQVSKSQHACPSYHVIRPDQALCEWRHLSLHFAPLQPSNQRGRAGAIH